MGPTGRFLGWSVAGVFGVARVADAACTAQHPLLCGEHHHIAAFAVAAFSNTAASISYSHVSISEGKVEAAPAPPPSPLSGLGVALLMRPDRPLDAQPIEG
jgi:hypothetical protein